MMAQAPWGDGSPLSTAPYLSTGDGSTAVAVTPAIFKDQNAASVTTTGNSVWAPGAGLAIRLLGGSVSFSVAASLEFRDGAANGTVLWRTPMLAANTAYNLPDIGVGRVGTANSSLVAVSTANGSLTGTLFGCEG